MRFGPLVLGTALAAWPHVGAAQTTPAASVAPSGAPQAAAPDRPWASSGPPHAPSPQDIDEARRRFQRGIELADAGNFTDALGEFTRAYQLTHNPRVLYNISASEEALGNVIDALDALRAYEAQAPGEVQRRQREALAAAETRLQNRVGTLVVESNAPEVEIRLDGLQHPASDMRAGIRLPAGRHHLALAAPGFAPREQDVEVPGNAALREVLTLVRLHANIAVESNVAGADVLLDGTSVGITPLGSAIDVSQGPHHVRVERAGYSPYETELNVGSEGGHVTASLAWAETIEPDVAARVLVQMTEPGARASLDGRGIALEGTDRLPPGVHHLRVERADRVPIEHEITLTPGHQAVVDVALVQTVAARQARVRSVQGWGWGFGGAGALVFLGGGSWFVANLISQESQQALVAGGLLTGLGLGGIAAGLTILLVAPHVDTGPREPTFRLRAGLGSIGAEWRF